MKSTKGKFCSTCGIKMIEAVETSKVSEEDQVRERVTFDMCRNEKKERKRKRMKGKDKKKTRESKKKRRRDKKRRYRMVVLELILKFNMNDLLMSSNMVTEKTRGRKEKTRRREETRREGTMKTVVHVEP